MYISIILIVDGYNYYNIMFSVSIFLSYKSYIISGSDKTFNLYRWVSLKIIFTGSRITRGRKLGEVGFL